MTVLALGRLRLTLLPVYRALADCERQGCRALPRPCPRVLLSRTNPQHGRGSNIGSAADLKTQGGQFDHLVPIAALCAVDGCNVSDTLNTVKRFAYLFYCPAVVTGWQAQKNRLSGRLVEVGEE